MAFLRYINRRNLKEFVRQRYVVEIMMLWACINMFSMRVSLSVAIVEMTTPEERRAKWSPDSACSSDYDNSTTTQTVASLSKPPELSWSEETQGLVLSAFFWGYVPSHISAPFIVNFLGGKYSLGISILITSMSTLLSPVAAQFGGYQWLILLRVLAGFGEGMSFPSISAILAHWIPPKERSTAVTFVFTGAQLGTVIGTALSGILLHSFAWPVTFYYFGLNGVVWCLLWQMLCYAKPSQHPFISESELKYITESVRPDANVRSVPLKAILTSLPVWGLMIGQVGHDWSFFTMITDLPSYMGRVLHYSIRSDGLLSALPYLIMWISSNIMAVLADWIIAKGTLSILQVRRILTMIASIGPALGIIAASYAGCDRKLVVAFLCLGMATMGAFYPGLRSNALDISKNYAQVIMALENGFGAISGILSPYIVGHLTSDNTVSEWRTVFWITVVVLVVTNIFYVIFAQASFQPWDYQQGDEQNTERKAEISLDTSVLSSEDLTYSL